MSLKQSIVIVNEFTNQSSAKGGATPGNYVMRYLNRDGASEVIAPFDASRETVDAFIERYMARSDATERLSKQDRIPSRLKLTHEFEQYDKLGGRSFDGDELSLSDKELRNRAERIQAVYDRGQTVLKTVISFSDDYLKESGLVDDTFNERGRGRYRGQIDQLKLRTAVQSGVNYLTKKAHFEEPLYVGVIQTDTEHVHAHIALCDEGFSARRLMPDGTDRGKLTHFDKENLRFGIDRSLNELQTMRSFSRVYHQERQNVRAFTERYTSEHLANNGTFQSLVASLPENKNHWRYGTNRQDMQRANELGKQYVESLFDRFPEESGYNEAMSNAYKYVNERVSREGLSDERAERLMENAYNGLVERSVNSVYGVVRSIDNNAFSELSRGVSMDSSSDDELMLSALDGDPFSGASYRMRHAAKRYQTHKSVRKETEEEIDVFHDAESGQTQLEAYRLLAFYESELAYHAHAESFYRRQFKPRLNAEQKQTLDEQYDRLDERYTLITELEDYQEALSQGSSLEGFSGYIRQKYEFRGDGSPQAVQSDIDDYKDKYRKALSTYGSNAFGAGQLSVHDYLRTKGIDLSDQDKPLKERLERLAEKRTDGEIVKPPALEDNVDEKRAVDLHQRRMLFELAAESDKRVPFNVAKDYVSNQRRRLNRLDEFETFTEKTGIKLESTVYDYVNNEKPYIEQTIRDVQTNKPLGLLPSEKQVLESLPKKRQTKRQLPFDYTFDGVTVIEEHIRDLEALQEDLTIDDVALTDDGETL